MEIRSKLANVIHTVAVSNLTLCDLIWPTWFVFSCNFTPCNLTSCNFTCNLTPACWPLGSYLTSSDLGGPKLTDYLADMPQPQDGEKFCGARINYRTKEPATCCADRSDDCTFIMSDGVSSTSGQIPTTSGQYWSLYLAPVLLWCLLYQRRRWLLPRLRWRMYAKYPANNGAHACFYSEGAWRRPRYSSVESISLPSLRKLFISNSKFRKSPKKILKIFIENFLNFSGILKKS